MDSLDVQMRWLLAVPVYACAYAVAALVFWRMARRRGFAADTSARIMVAGLIGGLIGANLLQLTATGVAGKAIEGGILGGWIAVVWMKRRLGVVRPTGDLFALAIPVGEAIGRIACFIGGCCYGRPAQLAWAVHDHGLWRHPAQLYASAAAACCFFTLLWVERCRPLPENGLFYLGGLLFCIDRFSLDFFRDAPATAAGVTLAQAACMIGILFFSIKLSGWHQELRRPVSSSAA